MIKYCLGIDGGGTSTEFKLFDLDANLLAKYTAGSIHFMKVTTDEMIATLKESKNYFIHQGYNFDEIFVAIGMAGYGRDEEISLLIKKSIDEVFPGSYLLNDAEFAKYSALGFDDGVYVIAGTGSVAFQILGNKQNTMGGYGYLLADEGSAFWIGKLLLEQFTKEHDGRIQRTDLHSSFMSHFNIHEAYELISIAEEASKNNNYRNWVAQLSGQFGDCEGAISVLRKAGEELAHMANAFKVEKGTKLSFGGSVLLKNKHVRDSFLYNLDKNYTVVEPPKHVEIASVFLYHKNK